MSTLSHRRRFQFSLRTLLILMLLVATYFAGFVTSQKLAEKERRKAEEKAAAELAAAKAPFEWRVFTSEGFRIPPGADATIKFLDPNTGIAEPPITEYRYRDPPTPQETTGP
jgi:hypothetical protein